MATYSKLASRLTRRGSSKQGGPDQPTVIRRHSVKLVTVAAVGLFAFYAIIATFWIVTGGY
jgi:hypothetical protein